MRLAGPFALSSLIFETTIAVAILPVSLHVFQAGEFRNSLCQCRRTFSNPRSREFKSGVVERLERPGNVFWDQNVHINLHYDWNPR